MTPTPSMAPLPFHPVLRPDPKPSPSTSPTAVSAPPLPPPPPLPEPKPATPDPPRDPLASIQDLVSQTYYWRPIPMPPAPATVEVPHHAAPFSPLHPSLLPPISAAGYPFLPQPGLERVLSAMLPYYSQNAYVNDHLSRSMGNINLGGDAGQPATGSDNRLRANQMPHPAPYLTQPMNPATPSTPLAITSQPHALPSSQPQPTMQPQAGPSSAQSQVPAATITAPIVEIPAPAHLTLDVDALDALMEASAAAEREGLATSSSQSAPAKPQPSVSLIDFEPEEPEPEPETFIYTSGAKANDTTAADKPDTPKPTEDPKPASQEPQTMVALGEMSSSSASERTEASSSASSWRPISNDPSFYGPPVVSKEERSRHLANFILASPSQLSSEAQASLGSGASRWARPPPTVTAQPIGPSTATDHSGEVLNPWTDPSECQPRSGRRLPPRNTVKGALSPGRPTRSLSNATLTAETARLPSRPSWSLVSPTPSQPPSQPPQPSQPPTEWDVTTEGSEIPPPSSHGGEPQRHDETPENSPPTQHGWDDAAFDVEGDKTIDSQTTQATDFEPAKEEDHEAARAAAKLAKQMAPPEWDQDKVAEAEMPGEPRTTAPGTRYDSRPTPPHFKHYDRDLATRPPASTTAPRSAPPPTAPMTTTTTTPTESAASKRAGSKKLRKGQFDIKDIHIESDPSFVRLPYGARVKLQQQQASGSEESAPQTNAPHHSDSRVDGGIPQGPADAHEDRSYDSEEERKRARLVSRTAAAALFVPAAPEASWD